MLIKIKIYAYSVKNVQDKLGKYISFFDQYEKIKRNTITDTIFITNKYIKHKYIIIYDNIREYNFVIAIKNLVDLKTVLKLRLIRYMQNFYYYNCII